MEMSVQPDPAALPGGRDLIEVITLGATLVSALSPLISHILERYSPPDSRHVWIIEEAEVRHPDGTVTLYRRPVLSGTEYSPYHPCPDQNSVTTTNHTRKTSA